MRLVLGAIGLRAVYYELGDDGVVVQQHSVDAGCWPRDPAAPKFTLDESVLDAVTQLRDLTAVAKLIEEQNAQTRPQEPSPATRKPAARKTRK